MLRCQTVLHRHDDAAGTGGESAGRGVVGVDAADDPAPAVEVGDYRWGGVVDGGPVDPNRQVTGGAGHRAVLDGGQPVVATG